MNRNIRTAIIAPMTTAQKRYPTRIACVFGGKRGEIVLDQIRTIDQSRLVKRLGNISPSVALRVIRIVIDSRAQFGAC
jgi:mRNA interferase MazF